MALNSARFDDFHQLDVRVDREWTFDTWRLTAYLDVRNVYNRANASEELQFDYTESMPRFEIPVVPSFGVRGNFDEHAVYFGSHALSACDDFDPREASTSRCRCSRGTAAQFGDTVQLTSIEYGTDIAKREWSICLLSLGPFKDYECFNEALIIPIDETDKSVSFTIDETLLAPLFMFLETDGSELAESCGDACLGRDGSEQTYLDLQVGLKTAWDDGSDMVTIKQVRVSLTAKC